MPRWTKIIICGARDKRGESHTYAEIRDFHRSYKDLKTGERLSIEAAEERLADGESGISRPWKEAGFHWAIAKGTSGEPEIVMLRPMTQNGAYAREMNLNRNGIGILCEDFSEPFLDRMAVLCKFLLKLYNIPPDQIFGRWEMNPTKNRPHGFCMDDFRTKVLHAILEGLLHNTPPGPTYGTS
jgi:hypothetical protein